MKSTYIVTYMGKEFDFLNLKSEDICIKDIAHALACINRFRGHTQIPYSVAEHCVRASYIPIGNPLDNLLHDADEAYIGDVPTPQKQNLGWYIDNTFVPYPYVETNIMAIIYRGLSLNTFVPGNTHTVDRIMLATEVRDLMPTEHVYPFINPNVKPLPMKIKPWSWKYAEAEYLRRFEELTR